jgi:4-hydroxy-tetrahydrodipicolinate reductase
MDIVVVGYGRMGHEIAAIATERGHTIVATVDPVAPDATDRTIDAAANRISSTSSGSQITAIDFSLPTAVPATIDAVCRHTWSLVLGTTGWNDKRIEVMTSVSRAQVNMVYGYNFSVGANLFIRVAAFAQRLAVRAGGYDTGRVELHHKGKRDSPSGTALMIAQHLLTEQQEKETLQVNTLLNRAIRDEEMHIISGRVGHIPGTHTVLFDSPADTVELTHRARNRGGFAMGAVLAAEWLQEHPGIHGVETFFSDLYQQ